MPGSRCTRAGQHGHALFLCEPGMHRPGPTEDASRRPVAQSLRHDTCAGRRRGQRRVDEEAGDAPRCVDQEAGVGPSVGAGGASERRRRIRRERGRRFGASMAHRLWIVGLARADVGTAAASQPATSTEHRSNAARSSGSANNDSQQQASYSKQKNQYLQIWLHRGPCCSM